jgi:hypothetical protein
MTDFAIQYRLKKYYLKQFLLFLLVFFQVFFVEAENSIDNNCPKTTTNLWTNCFGISNFQNGDVYFGEWKEGLMHGYGGYIYFNGNQYFGEFLNHQRNGAGIFINNNSETFIGEYKNDKRDGIGLLSPAEGIVFWGSFNERLKLGSGAIFSEKKNLFNKGFWKNEKLLSAVDTSFDCERLDKIIVNLNLNLDSYKTINNEHADKITYILKKLNSLNDLSKKSRFYSLNFCKNVTDINQSITNKKGVNTPVNQNFSININARKINEIGDFEIDISSKNILKSVFIDGQLVTEPKTSSVTIKKTVLMGAEVTLFILATDINGNSDSKTIKVVRDVFVNNPKSEQLKVTNVKQQPPSDAVAIIIGIEKYKRIAKADYANTDAQAFYDYAIRALGIKPENIKLLVDDGADDVEIYRVFQNWLPLVVKKNKTDIYFFYSGHGLPSEDGKSLYFLPWGVDKDFVEKTAINKQELISSLQASQPKSVTMFLDSCYSGQTKGGDTLLSSARPISLKTTENTYPANFTVISASAPDQLSSSSQELKHGIFSFFLMKGMEGDADLNKDGKITAGEMQEHLTDTVGRQAMSMNRKQQPQLIGNTDRVLVGK